jgi:hypothetical protein
MGTISPKQSIVSKNRLLSMKSTWFGIGRIELLTTGSEVLIMIAKGISLELKYFKNDFS